MAIVLLSLCFGWMQTAGFVAVRTQLRFIPISLEYKRIYLLIRSNAGENADEQDLIVNDTRFLGVQKDLQDLEQKLRRFVSENPQHGTADHYLGNVLDELGNGQEACIYWKQALSAGEINPYILNNLASYYSGSGDIHRAIRMFEQAIRMKSDEAVFYFNLGTMYYMFRDDVHTIHGWDASQAFDHSLRCLRQARDLKPDNYQFATSYAETFYGVSFFGGGDYWKQAYDAWKYCDQLNISSQQHDHVRVNMVRVSLYQGNRFRARQIIATIQDKGYRALAEMLIRKKVPEESRPTLAQPSLEI